jgi:Tol biopolymer transport system component
MRRLLALTLIAAACATAPAVTPAPPALPPTAASAHETHLINVVQLSDGGENAEAYWSFDGQSASLQRRANDQACDRIYTLQLFEQGRFQQQPKLKPISSGKGATTCSHWFPDGETLLYASTHLGGDACPPRPDMSKGYVWALYDTYDIFKANADGSGLKRLTDTKGYDAEGTVCGKDGSIVFTSVRDGDIELYRMDKDGSNVRRLTNEPGYDGGAFFNADCSKIVWRASRPKPGKELDDYRALLAQGLVRPTQLELYVAEADGSQARQVTYLNAASFAPFWFPRRERIIFSSNYGDPQGREFELWAINADGTDLERITYRPGFDGFPMFSPDGHWLLFSSNRATAPDQHDTNLFLARWDDHAPTKLVPGAAERIKADVAWLADPAREGRGVGTGGLVAAGDWLEKRLQSLGLQPLGDRGSYRAGFQVTTAATRGAGTRLQIAERVVTADQFAPLGFSAQGQAAAPLVLAGYGLQDAELGIDDYKGLDVKGKIVVVRRFVPEHEKLVAPEAQRKAGDLRKKAFVARTLGAKALLIVDWPVSAKPTAPAAKGGEVTPLPMESSLPTLGPEGSGDAGIPVLMVRRAALEPIWKRLSGKQRVDANLTVALDVERTPAFNVVGRIAAGKPDGSGPIIIGAHYDHLGFGGTESLAPDDHTPHLGADDNGSGTATVLEIARALSKNRTALTRDVVIALFSGEELGVLGSSALVAAKPAWLQNAQAMLNLDMVGRLRANTLTVLGSDSAPEWLPLIDAACDSAQVVCKASGDGYGPSDHMPFYAAGLPVLHFFTGAHSDYHKPSDTPDKLNDTGMARVADIVANVALGAQAIKLSFQRAAAQQVRGDARTWNASLGTVPDYAGPPKGQPGVLLADVRAGGGAEQAGMRRGDILTRLGKFEVRSVEDLMFVLMQAKPGETVTGVVLRDGKEMRLQTTFQDGRRH